MNEYFNKLNKALFSTLTNEDIEIFRGQAIGK